MIKNINKILLYIVFSSFLLFILFKFNTFILFIQTILNLINPIIYGFIIAYLLNIIMKRLERKIKNRKLNIFLSILIIIIIITLTILLLVPQIIKDIDILSNKIPNLINKTKEYIKNIPYINDIFKKISSKNIFNYIKNNYNGLLFKNKFLFKNIIYFFTNLFLGIIISVIMLNNKEKYIKRVKLFFKKRLNKDKYNKLIHVGKLSNEKFEIYFVGQFILSLLLSISIFILMIIFKIPYSLSISTLIFTLSLIPIIGLIIAYILSILLVISVSINKTIIFIIIIFISKQLIDYFIRPKVFEKKLNTPGIFLFIGVIYFSINFGIIGAIISIPITSILYDLYYINNT